MLDMYVYICKPRCKLSVKLKKCFKLNKKNKMNNVQILIYRTQYIYIYKDMKIDLKSSLVILVKKCKLGTTQEFYKNSKGSV